MYFKSAYADFQNRLTEDIILNNTAQCTIDSKAPTTKAIAVLSNVELGRTLLKLAEVRKEQNTDVFIKTGIEKYRYSVTQLIQLIHRKLAAKKLPLLPSDPSNLMQSMNQYVRISNDCSQTNRCSEMDTYLAKLWSASKTENSFDQIDNFSPENYLNSTDGKLEIDCTYLKKTSPFDSLVRGTKLSGEYFSKIANDAKNLDSSFGSCDDLTLQNGLRTSTYEFRIDADKFPQFDKQGFDYWNSIKIYFSWAFRNAPELSMLTYPYDKLFKSLTIEDSLFFISANCRSLTLPKCDQKNLSFNTMKFFSNHNFNKIASDSDFLKETPKGPTQEIIDNKNSSVSKIGLFSDYSTPDEWSSNLQKNFSQVRFSVRKKIATAASNITIINNYFVDKNINELLANKESQLEELYLMCSEAHILQSQDYGLLFEKIKQLNQLNIIKDIFSSIGQENFEPQYNKILNNLKSINLACQKLSGNKIFSNVFKLDRKNYSQWYLDLYQEDSRSNFQNTRIQKLAEANPILSLATYTKTKNIKDVICIDELDCFRNYFKFVLDLRSSVEYSDLFLQMNKEITSANFSDDQIMRKACGAYDPWMNTKKTILNTITSLTQGYMAAQGGSGLIFARVDLKPGTVTSFKKLIEDGKLVVSPEVKDSELITSIGINLGAVTSLPCTVAFSKHKELDPAALISQNTYFFKGISLATCNENSVNILQVQGALNSNNSENYAHSCAKCTIDFEQAAPKLLNQLPVIGATYSVIRSVIDVIKNISDPNFYPNTWKINPHLTSQSAESFGGKIPDGCLSKLTKGYACMQNTCDEQIINQLKDQGKFIKSIDTSQAFRGKAYAVPLKCKNNKVEIQISWMRDNVNNNEVCRLISPKALDDYNCGEN